jgi:glucose/arabinose dehydrogenase
MITTNPSFIAVFVACLTVSGPSAANERPINWAELPPPYQTKHANNSADVVAKPVDAKLELPMGFSVEEFHAGIAGPRFMLLGPGNEVMVADSSAGKVHVIHERQRKVLLSGLREPYGMVLRDKGLFIAESNSVKRYEYDSATREIKGSGVEIIALKGFESGHTTRTLLLSAGGDKLYVSIGSESNVSLGEPAKRAAINRYDIDGSDHEIFASGIRNAMGIRWYPGTETLWATTHERDGLGDDLPPDFLTQVEPGGFYGWPYAYIGPHEDPRHKSVAPEMVKKTLYPDVLFDAHAGAMDLIFYTGTLFPERYRGGAFVALHGSWNRSKLSGYKVVFVPFKSGKPTAGPENFLTGWIIADAGSDAWGWFSGSGKPRVWGRPVGLLQMPDGSMLVSDDGGGKIWRVTYRGSGAP